jgi:hypothetical protein
MAIVDRIKDLSREQLYESGRSFITAERPAMISIS